MRRAQLEHHLVVSPQVHPLDVLARGKIPEVQRMAVLVGQQQLRVDPVLDHGGGAPLAGDQRVLLEVPPRVIRQVLRPAVVLPGPQHVEGGMVEQRDPAGPVGPVGAAEAG